MHSIGKRHIGLAAHLLAHLEPRGLLAATVLVTPLVDRTPPHLPQSFDERRARSLDQATQGCLDTKAAPIASGPQWQGSPRYYEAVFGVSTFLLGMCLTATFLPRSWP